NLSLLPDERRNMGQRQSSRHRFERRRRQMKKASLVLGAAAVAFSAAPAAAKHYSNMSKCAKGRHGRCVVWHRLTRKQARRLAQYRVGYRFGPRYGYSAYSALPQPIVTQYNLR